MGIFELNATFNMKKPEGFLWYKERPLKHKNTSEKQAQLKTSKQTARRRHETLKKRFEDAVHEALDDPTIEKVKVAQRLQKQMVDKSEAFSKAWLVAMTDFDGLVDPSLSHNPLYLKMRDKEMQQEKEVLFKNLSKTYGVFYLFDQSCKYCHAFFPIVQKFCKEYGFEMIAVSRQGVALPMASSGPKVTFLKDNGIIKKLNTKGIFPAVFAANLKTESVIPIAWGMSTLDELSQNLERAVLYNAQQKKGALKCNFSS